MKLRYLFSLALFFCVTVFAYAQSIPPGSSYALSPDGSVVYRLAPEAPVAASSFDSSLLPTGWTSTTGTGGPPSVSDYEASFSLAKGAGGAQFQAAYDTGSALGSGQGVQYVQVINTNDPTRNLTSPYLDNPDDPSVPFYYLPSEVAAQHLPSNQLNFSDFSKRPPVDISKADPITWEASLYPVITNGTNSIAVQNGVSWGWSMKDATVGSDTATFVNPGPSMATVTGVGTNSFGWGEGDPSSLTFTGGTFNATVGTPFDLGKLTFHNGANTNGATSVGFNAAINFDNVPEKDFVSPSTFTLVNTPNTDDPFASADYVSLDGYNYTFHVFEGDTASADMMFTLSTGLTGSPSGASTDATLFSTGLIGENPDYTLTFDGFANPTDGGFVSTAPEPSSVAIIGIVVLFVAGLMIKARKRKIKASAIA